MECKGDYRQPVTYVGDAILLSARWRIIDTL